MIDLLLVVFVCFAVILIALGIHRDKKIKKGVIHMSIRPKRYFVRCARCSKRTSIEVSDYFDDIGIVCLVCSKIILKEPITLAPVPTSISKQQKKRNPIISFLKGDSYYE